MITDFNHGASALSSDPEEAMREYLAIMRGPADPVPPELRGALRTAKARKAAASRALAALDADVERDHAIKVEYENQFEAAEAAIRANDDVEAAEGLNEKLRVPEAKLTAARNKLRKSTDAQGLARAQMQAADAAVMAAAQHILHAELRSEFETWKVEHAQALKRREHLLGCYLGGGRAALSDREWAELDRRRGHYSCQELDIGLPLVMVHITSPDAWDLGDPKGARARIDATSDVWEQRLLELVNAEEET